MNISIWIGWDPREAAAFAVARQSVQRYGLGNWPVHGLVLDHLRAAGLYTRPMEMRPGVDRPVMWDVISGAPMSTEHANARFLVPYLARENAKTVFKPLSGGAARVAPAPAGWALFMDGDMMVCDNLAPLFASLDPRFAVYCVKHRFDPPAGVKMDGQAQTRYARKNWSSFLIFNCDHVANRVLTPELVNRLPGRDLHRLCWLEDDQIGELDPAWNFLVGHSDPAIVPKCIHWTDGVPDMRGYEDAPFADEWRAARNAWAA